MLFQLLIQLIRRDNEEIGLLASKTYMELYRAGRYVSEASVPLYIQLFLDIYAGSEQVVATLFSPDSPVMKEPKPEKSEIITYTKAMESLKLIAELPTSIIFVYQSLQQGTTSVPPLMTVVSAVAKVTHQSNANLNLTSFVVYVFGNGTGEVGFDGGPKR